MSLLKSHSFNFMKMIVRCVSVLKNLLTRDSTVATIQKKLASDSIPGKKFNFPGASLMQLKQNRKRFLAFLSQLSDFEFLSKDRLQRGYGLWMLLKYNTEPNVILKDQNS